MPVRYVKVYERIHEMELKAVKAEHSACVLICLAGIHEMELKVVVTGK